ncbi:MAG TPA: hypothetical protein VGI71_18050 [Scandinavium sp.]|jgi:hypothetical protein
MITHVYDIPTPLAKGVDWLAVVIVVCTVLRRLYAAVARILCKVMKYHSPLKSRERRRWKASRLLMRFEALTDGNQRLNFLSDIPQRCLTCMFLIALERSGLPTRDNGPEEEENTADGQFWVGAHRWLLKVQDRHDVVVSRELLALESQARKYGCKAAFVHTGPLCLVDMQQLRTCPSVTLIGGSSLLQILSGNCLEYLLHSERVHAF